MLGAAVLQANTIVDARIVDESVETSKLLESAVNGGGTVFRSQQIDTDKAARFASRLQFGLELLPRFGVEVHDDGDRRFLRAGASDGSADSLGATGDEDNFVVKLKVHGEDIYRINCLPAKANLRE